MYEVKVIIADASQVGTYSDEIINHIPEYYAKKYKSIKRKQEADQELTAGFLLKRYLDISSDEQLERPQNGKPMLQSGKPFFNLSHSGEYVVLAISDIDIGLDIEKIRDIHWPTVRKVFQESQQDQLENTPKTEQPQQFTKLWTNWEAKLKLSGTGFATDLGQKDAKGADSIVHCIKYKDYMITCAAYENFYMSVEETQLQGLGKGDYDDKVMRMEQMEQ